MTTRLGRCGSLSKSGPQGPHRFECLVPLGEALLERVRCGLAGESEPLEVGTEVLKSPSQGQ